MAALVLCLQGGLAVAENIDPNTDGSGVAYGENVGWINFKPSSGDGVTVTPTAVTGFAWGQNIGWIKLNPASGGVTNDAGRLSGLAWGENVGWINFGPAGQGVTIDSCGDFAGKAWGENIGWISFRSDQNAPFPFKLTTAWRPPDIVPPATSVVGAGSGWQKTKAEVSLSASDNACGSGVKEIRYTLDTNPEVVYVGLLTIAAEGTHILTYRAIDNALNEEPLNSLSILIDRTQPVLTVSVPVEGFTYYINQPVASTYSATDAGSGMGTVTGTTTSGEPLNTATSGTKTFTASATDLAGNTASATVTYSVIYPGNIGDLTTATAALAWGENVGWVNFKPSFGEGVTVSDAAVTGRAWGENIGWITLGPFANSVANNGAGQLSGFAYAENAGWINFSGVTVDAATGAFKGAAWGENIGWISFDLAANGIGTSWRPQVTTPLIMWENPADIMYGTPLSGVQLNATASVPGTFAYTPAQGAVLSAGPAQALSVLFTPSDSTTYTTATKTVTITVQQAPQSITFEALPSTGYGSEPIVLVATATSGMPVNFAATGPCAITGDQLSLIAAGTCGVTASQPGNENYLAATPVERMFTITKAAQSIAFETLADKTFGDSPFIVTATASSGLPVGFGVSGNCSVAEALVSISGAGSCTVTASQTGNENYEAASPVARTLAVGKATAGLSLTGLGATYDGTPKPVTVTTAPTGLTGLSITYNGSTTAPTAAGSYAVVASLNNVNYQADAANGTQVIAKASQSISFGSLANKTYGDADSSLSATASSGLTVTFTAAGACTVAWSSLHLTGAGGCTVTASQPGNANYNPAPDVAQTFNIAKATPNLTWPTPAPIVYGTPLSSSQLSATANVPGTFSYTPAAGTVLPVGTQPLSAAFTPSDSTNYKPGTVTTSISVRYDFAGFFRPVDNVALNALKAESAVPVKFSLGGNQGLSILAAGSPASQRINCDASAPVDQIEETVTAGSSSLSYDASLDEYVYVWKTEKSWAGTCRQLTVKLKDDTIHQVNFTFTK